MQFRNRISVAVGVLMLAGCAPGVDITVEEEAVRAVSARWLELSRQRNAAAIADLFADDGGVVWQNRPATSGRDNLEAFMRRAFAENPSSEGGFAPDRIDVGAAGDLAVEQGTYEDPADQGRYMTVYRKVGSDWKVAADMSVSTSPDGGAPDWATESLSRWYEAFNARDAQGLANLYTADARVSEARGRAAIIARFRAGWVDSDEQCSGGFDDFAVVGSIAAGRGRDVCTSTTQDGGPTATVYSNWLAIYERQADGSWLCIRDNGEAVEP